MPRLRWPDLRNARDLGGIPTVEGGRIRERALIRTDNHDRLNADGLAAIRSYGVSRIVDLRWHWEASKYPSPLAADDRYRLVPAFDPTGDEEIPSDSYRLMVDASRDRLANSKACKLACGPFMTVRLVGLNRAALKSPHLPCPARRFGC